MRPATWHRLQAIVIALTLGAAAACETPTSPAAPWFYPPDVNPSVRPIAVGETVTATLKWGGATCIFAGDDLTAPCERYSVTVSSAGTLLIQVTWDNPDHFLQIVFPWANTRGGICCRSPQLRRIDVTAGRTYEIEVWLIGATYGVGGHPPASASQTFEMTTTLEVRERSRHGSVDSVTGLQAAGYRLQAIWRNAGVLSGPQPVAGSP
jgi:hypothetical protein